MKRILLLIYLLVTYLVTSAQPSITVFPEDGRVSLSGNGGEVSVPTHVDIFRGTTNPPGNLYTTFIPTGYSYQWEDTDVENNVFYYYQVKVRHENSETESTLSNIATAMPTDDRGSYYIFDGIDDKVELLDKNFLISMTSLEFDFKIDELPQGKDTDIFRLQFKPEHNFDNRSSIRVIHIADELRVLIRQQSSGRNPAHFTVRTHNVADGEWHTLKIENLRSSDVKIKLDNTTYSVSVVSNHGSVVVGGIVQRGIHDIFIGEQFDNSSSYLKGGFDNLKIRINQLLRGQWNFDEPGSEPLVFDSRNAKRHMQKFGGILSAGDIFDPQNDIVNLQSVSTNTGTVKLDFPGSIALPTTNSFTLSRTTLPSGSTITLISDTHLINFFPFQDHSASAGTTYEYTLDYSIPLSISADTSLSVNDVTVPSTGFGTNYAFDGVDDAVTPNQAVIENTSGTIEFLVKIQPEDKPSGFNYGLLGKHESASKNGFVLAHDGGTVWCQFKDETSTANLYPAPGQNLSDGEWHHVALSFDIGNTAELYVDGELVASNSIPDFTFTSELLFVAKSPNTFWQPLKGKIDELVVWNKILTAEEIAERAFVKVEGDTHGLMAAYHFDESSGTNTYDDGLNNFHATINGATIGQTTAGIPILWTGMLDNSWDQPLNWNIGVMPNTGENITIASASNTPVITPSDAVNVNDLSINSGASLTVESSGILAIRGDATINGTYTVERRSEGMGRYSMIGSPLSDTDVSDFSASLVYAYDEPNEEYDRVTSGLAEPGTGFFVAFSALEQNPVISLSGQPNTGTIIKPLTANGISTSYFNLVANPYAAPLNYNSFIIDNSDSIEESIWLWDDGDANIGSLRAGDYMVVNSAGIVSSTGTGIGSTGSIWNGYIGSFQGFFVRTDITMGTNLTFTTDMQVTSPGSNNDQSHFRIVEEYPYQSIKLSMSGQGLYNEIIVALSDESTLAHDRLDATKIKGNPNISFYSWQEDEIFAIQGLPKLTGEIKELNVKLGFDLAETGDFELSVVEMKNIPTDYRITLKDHLLKEEYILDELSTIPFSLSEVVLESKRFELIFTQPSHLTDRNGPNKKLIAYGSLGGLKIHYPSHNYETVSIYGLDGRIVFRDRIKFEKHAQINPSIDKEGVYILRVKDQFTKFIFH